MKAAPVTVLILGILWSAPPGDEGAFSAGAAPAPPTATQPASAPGGLSGQIARRVDELVTSIGTSGRYRDRVAAEAELLELHAAFLAALRSHLAHPDREVRVRLDQVRKQILAQARLTSLLPGLPKELQDKLLRFQQDRPLILAGALSDEKEERIRALASLKRQPDPNAEGLLILNLQTESREVLTAAARAAEKLGAGSQSLADALAAVMTARGRGYDHWDWQDENYARGPGPRVAAMRALIAVSGKEAAPRLLAVLLDREHDSGKDKAITAALTKMGDKRVIPHLMGLLSDRDEFMSWGSDRDVATAACDFALLAMLKLTGQSAGGYGIIIKDRDSRSGDGTPAFKTKDQRDKAIEKFRAWWEAHKDRPPYKDLEPLKVAKPPKRDTPWPLLVPRGRLLRPIRP